jgi:hypothetical protein
MYSNAVLLTCQNASECRKQKMTTTAWNKRRDELEKAHSIRMVNQSEKMKGKNMDTLKTKKQLYLHDRPKVPKSLLKPTWTDSDMGVSCGIRV